jgi:MFS family permease
VESEVSAVLTASAVMLQVFYYSTLLFISSGLTEESAKFATIGIGAIMVGMTLVSIPLMDRTGRRTLHLYGLGGMFIFSIFITISFLIKVRKKDSGWDLCSSLVTLWSEGHYVAHICSYSTVIELCCLF